MEEFKKWSFFLLPYKFALDELKTKINIMVKEAKYMKDYNGIEHIKTRLKTPKSITSKLDRKGFEPSIENAKDHLFDIAGLRIVCSFTSDVYDIYNLLLSRRYIRVLEVKDYIRFPKPNGYQSLHMILEIPITLTDKVENVLVEIQIRTLAMDFWASLEHKIWLIQKASGQWLRSSLADRRNPLLSALKECDGSAHCLESVQKAQKTLILNRLYYKFNQQIPEHLEMELKEAADSVKLMDEKMKVIRDEVQKLDEEHLYALPKKY